MKHGEWNEACCEAEQFLEMLFGHISSYVDGNKMKIRDKM